MGEQQDAFETTLSVLKLSPELESLLRDVAAGRTTLTPAAASAAGIPEQAYEAVLRASEEHAAASASPPASEEPTTPTAPLQAQEETRDPSDASDRDAEDDEGVGGRLQ